MATLPLRTLFGTLLALCCMHAGYSLSPEEREAARSVMERTVPALKAVPGKLKLEAVKQENGCDVFETESSRRGPDRTRQQRNGPLPRILRFSQNKRTGHGCLG